MRAAAGLVPAAAFVGAAGGAPARAQSAATPDPAPAVRPPWRGAAELSGNVLFGAASQRLVATLASAARADSTLALRAEFQSSYGDARDATNLRRVVARTVRLAGGADFRPGERVTPFVLGDAESNFQQRIRVRAAVGAGAKRTLWRPAAPVRGFPEDASVSLAVLAERTRALGAANGVTTGRGAGTRVRWSLRTRLRRQLTTRAGGLPGVRITHLTLYQPTVDAPGRRATAESTTALSVPLAAGMDLTATLRDRFDSEARRRGARSNHDGQLLFGVRAGF
jgi:hypothetical protein